MNSLDKINTRRVINHIKRSLTDVCDRYLFEAIDPSLQARVKDDLSTALTEYVDKETLYDFSVVCDESINTPERVANNMLCIDVAIKPVPGPQFIYIPIRITSTGMFDIDFTAVDNYDRAMSVLDHW